MLLVVDAYDRRIERTWFADALALVLDTGARIGSYTVLSGVRADLAAGRVNDQGLTATLAALQEQIESNRVALTRRMATLAELPWSTDTIH